MKPEDALPADTKSRFRVLEASALRAWLDGKPREAAFLWEKLAAVLPLLPNCPVNLALAADTRGEFRKAEKIVADAWARGARSDALDERLFFYRIWNRHSALAREECLAIAGDPASPLAKTVTACLYLLAENVLEPARAGLARVARDAADTRIGRQAAKYLLAADILAKAGAQGRAPISGHLSPARDAILVREPGADTTVIVFTLGGELSLPVNAVHALLQPAKVNAIYLFDDRNQLGLAGNSTFGRPYAAMCDGLRRKLAAWGTRRLVIMGHSACGYTALRLGLDLAAHGVLCFSPIATLYRPPESPIETAKTNDDARAISYEVFLRETIPEMMTDLRPDLCARTCLQRIAIHFGAKSPADMLHAQYLAGVPGVEIFPVEGLRDHDSLPWVLRQQPGVLSRFVENVRKDRN
ncbi:MAG TPA: hypothetical protein VGF56_14215 [Rhizomicrobium sp.]|jgi:pimeloyl-ACP methyl ester carboxylesterase